MKQINFISSFLLSLYFISRCCCCCSN